MSNTAVAVQGNKLRSVLAGDYFKAQVKMCLPKHLTPERFIRMALTAIMRTPKLAECTEASVTKCMLQLSELGIEPDGRRAHLIPFENRKMGTVECTLIVDWKGLAELAMRSGIIGKLHADVICENDEFAYDLGDILHHRIDFKKSRGEPYAAYAMAVTKDGQKLVQVMTKDEIEKIRDGSQGWMAFKKGWARQSPWQDSPGEMWKKTVFRRLSKWLPLSPEIHEALEKEEAQRPTSSIVMTDLTPPEAPAIEAGSPIVEVSSFGTEPKPEGDDGDLGPQTEPEKQLVPPPARPVASPKPADKPKATPKTAAPQASTASPREALEKAVMDAGHTFDDFVRWAEGVGAMPDASSYGSFGQFKKDDAVKFLRVVGSVVNGIAEMKSPEEGGAQ